MSKPSALEIDQLRKAAFLAGVDFGTEYYDEGVLGTPVRERGYKAWAKREHETAVKFVAQVTRNIPRNPPCKVWPRMDFKPRPRSAPVKVWPKARTTTPLPRFTPVAYDGHPPRKTTPAERRAGKLKARLENLALAPLGAKPRVTLGPDEWLGVDAW